MADIANTVKFKYLAVIKFFVGLVWYLSWLGMTLLVGLMIASALFDFQIKYIQIPVEVSYEEIYDNPLNDSHTVLPVVGFSNPRVDTDNIEYQNAFYLIPLILLAGLLVILFQVRKFIGTVQKGSPFVEENPKRLKLIGLILTFGPIFYAVANSIYGHYYRHFLDLPGAEIDVIKNSEPFVFISGLIVLVIAKVFEYGVQLQTEQDLTV